MPNGSPSGFDQTQSTYRPEPVTAPAPAPAPAAAVKRDFYNTSFLPSVGNVDGGWWDPAYYMFFLTILLILINAVYINIKTKGKHIGLSLFFTIILFIKTYFFTRGSSCLWAGGCQVFAVFHLIFPFIFIIIVFLIEDIAIRMMDMNVDYSSLNANGGSSREPSNPSGDGGESDGGGSDGGDSDGDDPDEDDPPVNDPSVDGFSNTIEPFGSYYPY